MKIDRRITNGLAWAGAALVVAIPTADFALRQFSPAPVEQVAIIGKEAEDEVTLPTSTDERPLATEQTADTEANAQPDPITTAATRPQQSSSGSAVDNFVQSGRPMPSYISGETSSSEAPATQTAATETTPPRTQSGNASAASTPARPSQTTTTTPAASTPATTPASTTPATTPAPATNTQTASLPPRTEVTMPTPVSQRPTPVPQSQVTQARPTQPAQAPLVIEDNDDLYTADDLADWESGPLSDYLANRGGRTQAAPEPEGVYDDNGFFLDEGPNAEPQQRFPRAYGEGFYYPFSN